MEQSVEKADDGEGHLLHHQGPIHRKSESGLFDASSKQKESLD
jgi:hypothetical protein